MALQPVTFRLEPDVIEAVAREASRKGVSSSVFMRTAVVFRIGFCAAQRGERSVAVGDAYEALERAVLGGE